MKLNYILVSLLCMVMASCQNQPQKEKAKNFSQDLSSLFDKYYEDRLHYFPLEATAIADNRFNDSLPCDISDAFRKKLKGFYEAYLSQIQSIDRASLSTEDQISYDVFFRDMQMQIKGLDFSDHLMPINQFWSMPLTFAQLGSGGSNQPFKTSKDYDNFLGRIDDYIVWTDTAISNMKRGMERGITPPDLLMKKVLPQLKTLLTDDYKKSVFYMPIHNFPKNMGAEDQQKFSLAYQKAIQEKLNPSINKLYDFIKTEYIPKCRKAHGISAIPGGKEYYAFLVQSWTTTETSPDTIFEIGKKEVARLRAEMEKVKNETGFKGDLKAFFHFMHTDAQFMPYHSEAEVLNAYRSVELRMQPQLKKLFNLLPKAKFEVRQTEKFREASASPEYSQSAPDGSRPGIFYVPIINPKKYSTLGMEDLFLHEAIPGHHYQTSIQQENTSLPKFRRFGWYGAYGEGWALYTESLGKELGLYTDPYQYFGSLSEEMHRAIRLVVDVGMHLKGWSREQAIQFSLDNEAESEADITSEIERYMAIPGQALAYKTGQMKIIELRKKAEKLLGNHFNIQKFHDKVLIEGCLPLDVFEKEMNRWMNEQK